MDLQDIRNEVEHLGVWLDHAERRVEDNNDRGIKYAQTKAHGALNEAEAIAVEILERIRQERHATPYYVAFDLNDGALLAYRDRAADDENAEDLALALEELARRGIDPGRPAMVWRDGGWRDVEVTS